MTVDKANKQMPNEIISYLEMCQRKTLSLQKGMNFHLRDNHSVILMSLRRSAPYEDAIQDGGTTIIYEGHDVPRSAHIPNPKTIDQPERSFSGNLTENSKFHAAAQEYKSGLRPPERVRVYEKIKNGIWSYNGVFHLTDSWREPSGGRRVFKFKLEAVEGEEDFLSPIPSESVHRRIIPTAVKLSVWKRDNGQCVQCGSKQNLHFDHVIPFSIRKSVEIWQSVAREYEREHPEFRIQFDYLENEEFKAKLPRLLESNDRPSVFFSYGGGVMLEQIRAGVCQDITNAVAGDFLRTWAMSLFTLGKADVIPLLADRSQTNSASLILQRFYCQKRPAASSDLWSTAR
jgi:hypothetical protein